MSINRIHQSRARRGVSLLEVTIGSLMVAGITMMAASVAVDMTRGMGENIRRTRIATQARLSLESFRRDLGGCDPDRQEGDRAHWRLVGRQIPNEGELRLCFDSDANGSADWAAPDRVITYDVDDGQLIRSDLEMNQTIVIANLVDSVAFSIIGSEMRIEIDFELGNLQRSYIFNTRDL